MNTQLPPKGTIVTAISDGEAYAAICADFRVSQKLGQARFAQTKWRDEAQRRRVQDMLAERGLMTDCCSGPACSCEAEADWLPDLADFKLRQLGVPDSHHHNGVWHGEDLRNATTSTGRY